MTSPGSTLLVVPGANTVAPENGFRSARRLWASLPRELATCFALRSSVLCAAIVGEVQDAVPEYRGSVEEAFGPVVVHCVRLVITRILRSVGETPAPPPPAPLFRRIGEIEFAEGRGVECLQTAYRVGGRAVWRYLSEIEQAAGVDPNVLCATADAIFAYVEEISTLSVEGYRAAQGRVAGPRARHRKRLLNMLVGEAPAVWQALSAQALTAEWSMPAEVTCVALEPATGGQDFAEPDLHPEVLADLGSDEPFLVTGDAARHLDQLAARLHGRRAVVGPTVRLAEVRRSLLWARRTQRLVARGVLPDEPVVRCADHLATLVLLADDFLVRQLCARSLEPLDGLTPKQRSVLSETLLVWLQSRDSAPEIAKKLRVHPQTVRYRLHQIHDLFGVGLSDPDTRLSIEIALRAQVLLGPPRRPKVHEPVPSRTGR
ncbi:helix-turn-helix domain-containing protein [Amycolatopsis sp. cmx-4-83]|uniref:PucR family transcriptional regulator n=1 Tax=Amycolatopsis sp. cmx-4-83 TaxID=2790940 RepID=UPI003978A6C7